MWKGVLYNLYNSCDNSNKINQVDLIEKKYIYIFFENFWVKTHRQKTKNSPWELISNHFEAASNDILELQLCCSFQNLEIWKVVKRKFPYFGQWLQWTVPVFSHSKSLWKLIFLQDKIDICERLRDMHCFIFRYKQFWIY